MSDAEFDYREVHAAARHSLEQAVRADMALRRSSLETGVSDLFPSVLAVRRMETELRFLLTKTETNSWVFGLFEDSTELVLVDLRFRMEVGAALETSRASSADARLEFAPPAFLRPDPSGTSTTIDCPSGRRIRLTGRGQDFRITDETLNLGLGRKDAWPLASLVDLLDAIRVWCSSGESAEPVPFITNPNSNTGKLFRTLANGQTRLVRELRGVQRRRGAALFALRSSHPDLLGDAIRLHREHPDFVPRYEVNRLETRTLVRWDEKGRLILKGSGAAWVRGHVTARCLPDREPPRCRLTMTLPDAQVAGGPHFRAFLRSLTDPDRNLLFVRLLRDKWSLPERTARRFLDRLDEDRCLLIRIDAADHDLVLLRGTRYGTPISVLLGVKFEVEMKDGRLVVTRKSTQYFHTWSGDPGDEGIVYFHYPGFFFRLFKILLRYMRANRGAAQ